MSRPQGRGGAGPAAGAPGPAELTELTKFVNFVNGGGRWRGEWNEPPAGAGRGGAGRGLRLERPARQS